MATREGFAACIGCGALVPDVDGPTHRYIGASPGCWAAYGELLAREFSDARAYAAHRLTVDTYAVQHPGVPSRLSIQSVAVHLISLCLVLEEGYDFTRATEAMRQALTPRGRFAWLSPPSMAGTMTVLDMLSATDLEQHIDLAQRWARSVWGAWAPHHATIRRWAETVTSRRR
jgi:hypothetical protein